MYSAGEKTHFEGSEFTSIAKFLKEKRALVFQFITPVLTQEKSSVIQVSLAVIYV